MRKMHSDPKHFENGTSSKLFSLCRNLCRLLPVNGKSVLFSYAVPTSSRAQISLSGLCLQPQESSLRSSHDLLPSA